MYELLLLLPLHNELKSDSLIDRLQIGGRIGRVEVAADAVTGISKLRSSGLLDTWVLLHMELLRERLSSCWLNPKLVTEFPEQLLLVVSYCRRGGGGCGFGGGYNALILDGKRKVSVVWGPFKKRLGGNRRNLYIGDKIDISLILWGPFVQISHLFVFHELFLCGLTFLVFRFILTRSIGKIKNI